MIFVIMGHIDCPATQFEQWFYTFSLPLFIIVSGILMKHHLKLSPRVFLKKQVRSLLYPYMTFSLFRIIQKTGYEHPVPEILESTIKGVTFTGEGVLWYLPSLFFAQLILYILIRKRQLWLLSIPLLQVMLFSSLISGNYEGLELPVWYFLNLWNRICIMVLFLAVGCLWRYRVSGRITKKWSFPAALILVITFLLTPLIPKPDLIYSIIGNPLVYLSEAVVNSCSILVLLQTIPFLCNKGLAWIGRNSLLIFLTHTTFWITGWAQDLAASFEITQSLEIMGFGTIVVLLAEIPVVWIMKHCISWMYKCPFQN